MRPATWMARALPALLAGLLSCSDDDRPRDECLASGCITGQTITYDASATHWAPGSYSAEVTAGGGTSTCTFTVDEARADVNGTCDSGATASFGANRVCSKDDPSACVLLDGYRLTVLVPGSLPEFRFQLRRGSESLADWSQTVSLTDKGLIERYGCSTCGNQALNLSRPD